MKSKVIAIDRGFFSGPARAMSLRSCEPLLFPERNFRISTGVAFSGGEEGADGDSFVAGAGADEGFPPAWVDCERMVESAVRHGAPTCWCLINPTAPTNPGRRKAGRTCVCCHLKPVGDRDRPDTNGVAMAHWHDPIRLEHAATDRRPSPASTTTIDLVTAVYA